MLNQVLETNKIFFYNINFSNLAWVFQQLCYFSVVVISDELKSHGVLKVTKIFFRKMC